MQRSQLIKRLDRPHNLFHGSDPEPTTQKEMIMKLLHIDSSILAGNSVSRELTKNIVAQWQASHPAGTLDYLDLAADAPSHLSAESIGFRIPPDGALTDGQRRENAISEVLVSQFLAADVIVIGAALYNFSIPTQLKAWIDRIAQAGRTFTYTDKGPKGLAGGKTVIIAISRGGVYSTSEGGQESYLKVVLGFLGVTDIRFVRAEGLAMGEAAKAGALAAAALEIKAVTAVAANQSQSALAA
jgi:FMN-dependent NADH-azoreductase